MTDYPAKVPNPRKADLEKLRSDLAKEIEALSKALKKPTEEFGGGDVWVGKNARTWHRELAGRHRRLGEQVAALLPLVEAAITSEPEKVGRKEARTYHDGA
ncbi:hypothetical protein AB0436_24350 [Streptomyces sp. NPDC051322]|uniref:hypothetical protein n=1 Tax=Streptomyces sp. NPDC051322 TaxID=3154645 RepID=UPI00344F6EA7